MKQGLSHVVVRHHEFQQLPKPVGVILMPDVTKLVGNHIVDKRGRSYDNVPIQPNVVFRITTALAFLGLKTISERVVKPSFLPQRAQQCEQTVLGSITDLMARL